MAIMSRYCKAFSATTLRQFPGWPASDPQAELPEYLFLHEDLRVTGSIFTDEQVVFSEITPEWEGFCHDVLKFAVPNEVRG